MRPGAATISPYAAPGSDPDAGHDPAGSLQACPGLGAVVVRWLEFVASLAFGFAKGLPTPLSTFSEGGAFIAYGLVGLVIARGCGTRSVGSCSGVGRRLAVVFGCSRDYSQAGHCSTTPLRPARCSRTGSETGRGSPSSRCCSPTRSCYSPTGGSRAGDGGPSSGLSRSSRSHGRWPSPSSSTTTRTGSTSPPPTVHVPRFAPVFDTARLWISFLVIATFGLRNPSRCVPAIPRCGARADPVVDVRRGADGGMVHAAAGSRQRGRRRLHPGVRPDVDPISIGIAILQYRLYDIDVVIRKTLVVGVLAVFIGAVYVAVVVGLGSFADSPALRIAATALVAVAFQPSRDRANRWANPLEYGARATPYEFPSVTAWARPTRATTSCLLCPRDRQDARGKRRGVAPSLRDQLRLTPAWPVAAPRRSRSATARSHRGRPCRGGPPPRRAARVIAAPGRANLLTHGEAELVDRLADQAGLILANARLTADQRPGWIRSRSRPPSSARRASGS